VVVQPQEPAALGAIQARAEALDAPVRLVGRDIALVDVGDRFAVLTPRARYRGLRVPLAGRHQRVNAEARAAFGNGDVYLERYVTSLRHIEVQLLRDTQGNTRVLGLRDCSVQRDKQKVFEESDSTMLPDRSSSVSSSAVRSATWFSNCSRYLDSLR